MDARRTSPALPANASLHLQTGNPRPCWGWKARGALFCPKQRAGGCSSKPRLLEPNPLQPPETLRTPVSLLEPSCRAACLTTRSNPRRDPSPSGKTFQQNNLEQRQRGETASQAVGTRSRGNYIKRACREMSFMAPAELWMLRDQAGSTVHTIWWGPSAPMGAALVDRNASAVIPALETGFGPPSPPQVLCAWLRGDAGHRASAPALFPRAGKGAEGPRCRWSPGRWADPAWGDSEGYHLQEASA